MDDGRPIRIDGLRRTVADLRRAVDFYCGALGFTQAPSPAIDGQEAVRVRLGEQHIDLLACVGGAGGMPMPASAPDVRFQHAAIVTSDIDAACSRLDAHAPDAISRGGPQRLPADTGGVSAFKFRDPDGHPLELIQFPAGVGDPRWQTRREGQATIGIDHFAIVVSSIERSVAFFALGLGWRVVSRGVNRGIEQDCLDGLDGVVVDVVALAPPSGVVTPHLELLGYRDPEAGKLPPPDDAVQRAARDEIVCIGASTERRRDPDGHRFLIEPRATRPGE